MTTLTGLALGNFVRRSQMVWRRGCGSALRIGVVSASVLLFANAGQAQVSVAPVAIGVGGYGGRDGVGTAESSAAHGYADLYRSEGYYNMLTAQGWVYAEQARNLAIQNQKQASQAYWAGREFRSALDAQKREGSRHSAEALNIAGKFNAPQPLGPEHLNPQTGTIVWPKALLDNKYAARRTEIETFFQLQTKTPGGSSSQTQIQAATGKLTSLLKKDISRMSATEYVKARKFLDSLAVSAS